MGRRSNRIGGGPGRGRFSAKTEVVFDDLKRQEYLTGFHKRKVARREKALAEQAAELEAERKKLKSDHRAEIKKMLANQPGIPEVAHLIRHEDLETEHSTVEVEEVNLTGTAYYLNEKQRDERNPVNSPTFLSKTSHKVRLKKLKDGLKMKPSGKKRGRLSKSKSGVSKKSKMKRRKRK